MVKNFLEASINNNNDSTTETTLISMWINKKDIHNIDKLMSNHEFRKFLTWLIERPEILDGSTMFNGLYHRAISWWVADKLNSQISEF